MNYGVDQYYKETLKTGGGNRGPNKPQAPKPPNFQNIYDFQFYPAPLTELLGKEILAFRVQFISSKIKNRNLLVIKSQHAHQKREKLKKSSRNSFKLNKHSSTTLKKSMKKISLIKKNS